jgi:8-oxo-dGTP diphosphatase
MPYTYKYPRPAVTVDVAVFGIDAGALGLLLVERGREPFKGHWALPGGFVHMGEGLDEAARRELEEETGVTPTYFEQLHAFGAPRRDPRGRTISVAYLALVKVAEQTVAAASDAADAKWYGVEDLPELAFDHADMIRLARQRLRARVRSGPLGFELLPARFSLPELQRVHELVQGRGFDKSNFRKKMLETGLLRKTRQQHDGPRKSALYEFDAAEYERLTRLGHELAI